MTVTIDQGAGGYGFFLSFFKTLHPLGLDLLSKYSSELSVSQINNGVLELMLSVLSTNVIIHSSIGP